MKMSPKLSGSFLFVLLWSLAICQGYLSGQTAKRSQLGFKLHKPHHICGLVASSSLSDSRYASMGTRVHAKDEGEDEEKVKVGSGEYYQGFVSRGLNEELEDRVSGDAIITPILKGAAITTVALGAFFLLFLKSNDLI
jgi:hypothetical protein